MIAVDDAEIALRRDTEDGRFLLFCRSTEEIGTKQPWSSVMADIGGDGFGVSVRLCPKPGEDAWSATDLLWIVLERARAEENRRLGPLAVGVAEHLRLAFAAECRRQGKPQAEGRLRLVPGPLPSPYPWTVAIRGPHHLPLCPDAECWEEGFSPEQLLMILDQLYADAVEPTRWTVLAREHVLAALEDERRRMARVRRGD